jgi:hypothetical protein
VVSTGWLFFSSSSTLFFSFLNLFFCPMPAVVSPTYLHLDYLPMHKKAYSLPHLPTCPTSYPPTYPPTQLPTYALNLQHHNHDQHQWGYCNKLGRLFTHPS